MREILFRGKCLRDNEWFYGFLTKYPSCIQLDSSHPYFIEVPPVDPDAVGGFYNVDVDTVGQYTGLTDKNGKKIFEGDIVLVRSFGYVPLNFRGVVIFDNCCFCVSYDYYGPRLHRIGSLGEWQDMGASGTITYSYEVVGNVYDNPDIPLTVIKE